MKAKDITELQNMSKELVESLPVAIMTDGNGKFFDSSGRDVVPSNFVGVFNRLVTGAKELNGIIQEIEAVRRKSS